MVPSPPWATKFDHTNVTPQGIAKAITGGSGYLFGPVYPRGETREETLWYAQQAVFDLKFIIKEEFAKYNMKVCFLTNTNLKNYEVGNGQKPLEKHSSWDNRDQRTIKFYCSNCCFVFTIAAVSLSLQLLLF